MERLTFDRSHPYSAVEAAIHLARYAIAAPFCPGARVLDIASGEGYGSRFLASAGATEVIGVERDEAVVRLANKRFAGSQVHFHSADAIQIAEVFEPESFDLVVSLETIEHLHAPARFLRGLKSVARPSATLVISCPNDHWYFPDPADRNPYHVRKYSFNEFRELSESVLGPAAQWLVGGPVMGFGTISVDADVLTSLEASQLRMNDYSRLQAAFAVPAGDEKKLEPRTSSYFVGIWGDFKTELGSAVVYPLSMDAFESAFYPVDCRQLTSANQELAADNQRLLRELETLAEQVSGRWGWWTPIAARAYRVYKRLSAYLSNWGRRS